MLHVSAKNEHAKSTSFGQEVMLPATVVECPPLKVFGVRGYALHENGYGMVSKIEVHAEKADRHLLRRMHSFQKKASKKEGKKTGKEKAPRSWNDVEKVKSDLKELRLLVHTQPALVGFGKKKPEVSEIALNGTMDEQLAFAKEKMGQSVSLKDVFEQGQMIDVKSVSKGKGMQGVIKRHHVKMQRHKAKKPRTVGAISPWHPPTVMNTVARPGQMGYNFRTEFNKKILELGSAEKTIAPSNGFGHYGLVKNDFLVLLGSIPGPNKRCIGLRQAIRNIHHDKDKWGPISFYSTVSGKRVAEEKEEPVKLEKVKVEKEAKVEHKSVEQELKEAAEKK